MAITVERLEAQVEANSAKAVADLAALDVALDTAARDRTAHVNIDTDRGAQHTAALLTQIKGLGDMLASSFEGVSKSMTDMAANGAANASTALEGINGAGGKANKSLMDTTANVGGVAGQVIAAIQPLAIFAGMFTLIYTGATLAVGALQMLTAAAAGVVGALAPLVGLLGAIPVGLGAIGGGIGTVVLGFMDVTKAVTAMDAAQNASTRSTYSAAAAARELKSARQGIVDANKAVARAEKDLQRAQEGVVEAQKQAAKDLVEQRRAVRDAVWNEEDAVDRLKRAQENLAKAQAGAGKSAINLTKATDDFTGKVYEVARVSGDSVDGVDAVTQAQRDLVHAQEDVQRATERRKDAQAQLTDMEKKGIKNSDKVVEANRRLEDAQESLARQHDNVAAAVERLSRVQEEQATRAAGGAAAQRALAAAMAKLTPTGQKFAKFIHGELMPAFTDLQKAAQDGMLPGFQTGLERLLDLLPTVKREVGLWATDMGKAFDEFMQHVTGKEVVGRMTDLSKVFREVLFGDGKKMKGLVDALSPLADILLSITQAAAPMTKMLTDGIVRALDKLAAWMQKPANAKRMTKFFNDSYYFLRLWGNVLKPLAGIFGRVADAAKPLGEWMLKNVAGYLDDINNNLKKPGGIKALKKWFDDMKPAIKETAGFLSDLVKAIFAPTKQGTEDSPFTKTMKALRDEWIPSFERLLKALGGDNKSGPSFVDMLTDLTNALASLVENPEDVQNFVHELENLVSALSNLVEAVRATADSPAWDALRAMQKTSVLGIVSWWVDMKRENGKGINEWEAYTRPKLTAVRDGIAKLLNFIPVIGPVLSAVFKFVTDRWMDIAGIFLSGDIPGAVNKLWTNILVNTRRAWAMLINDVVDAYNKIAAKLHIPKIDFHMDLYAEGGGTDKGRSTAGSSSKSGPTGRKEAMRQFGGPLKPGKYVVGEKRPEVLEVGDGNKARIAAAVPRPLQSTAPGLTEEQLDRVLQKVLEKAKPNVDMHVDQHEHADPKALASELAWSLR